MMNLPPELQAMIAELRSQHAELAGVSDEQILVVLQRAQSRAAAKSSVEDLDEMAAEECGALGEQLLHAGRWDEGERCFFAALEKAKQAGDLDQQCKAALALGRLCGQRGHFQQAMTLLQQSLGVAERLGNRRLQGADYNQIVGNLIGTNATGGLQPNR